MGQHPTGAAALGQVEDCVDDLSLGVGPRPADPAVAMREEVLDVGPLEVGEITRVAWPGRGAQATIIASTGY
jgi:hypothetical protein